MATSLMFVFESPILSLRYLLNVKVFQVLCLDHGTDTVDGREILHHLG